MSDFREEAMENIIDVLQSRGMVDALSSEELRKKAEQPLRVYAGFDPTADSLHVGNLVAIMGLAWFQKCGHTPVAIVGGATGMVGDPSGKDKERPLLDAATIQRNLEGIRRNLEAVLDFDHPTAQPIILNNYDWFGRYSLIEFLRDVGKQFRMGPMLSRDSVRTRLASDEGMSFTEFSYQILQGYDFLHLYQEYGVTVQLGGSDQWGNIVGGAELVRKVTGGEAYALTLPLLTRSDGKKFGKSESGAIWLAPEKLSPYQFYQYLFSFPDADVVRLLKVLTFLELPRIEEIARDMEREGYVPNTAQKILATEVTRIVHGEQGVLAAHRATESVHSSSKDILDAEALENAAADLPSSELQESKVLKSSLIELMVEVGLQKSKGEARRLMRNGGCYLNNQQIDDEARLLQVSDLIDGRLLLLGAGRKRKHLVRVIQ